MKAQMNPQLQPAVFLRLLMVAVTALLVGGCSHSFHHRPSMSPASPYAQWSRGPSTDPGFFPIAVWMQDPALATRYREAGFNTYVALRPGPTEEQHTPTRPEMRA